MGAIGKVSVIGVGGTGTSRSLQRVPLGQRDLFALLHLQARLGIEAIDTLVLDCFAGLAQFQIDHAHAVRR